jgi:hypothetical protein
LLRGVDRFLDLSELRQHLTSFYSHAGRPSSRLPRARVCRLRRPQHSCSPLTGVFVATSRLPDVQPPGIRSRRWWCPSPGKPRWESLSGTGTTQETALCAARSRTLCILIVFLAPPPEHGGVNLRSIFISPCPLGTPCCRSAISQVASCGSLEGDLLLHACCAGHVFHAAGDAL